MENTDNFILFSKGLIKIDGLKCLCFIICNVKCSFRVEFLLYILLYKNMGIILFILINFFVYCLTLFNINTIQMSTVVQKKKENDKLRIKFNSKYIIV